MGAPGLISDTVDLKRHDLAAIEKARAVVILVPKSAASISNAVATTVRFVYGNFDILSDRRSHIPQCTPCPARAV